MPALHALARIGVTERRAERQDGELRFEIEAFQHAAFREKRHRSVAERAARQSGKSESQRPFGGAFRRRRIGQRRQYASDVRRRAAARRAAEPVPHKAAEIEYEHHLVRYVGKESVRRHLAELYYRLIQLFLYPQRTAAARLRARHIDHTVLHGHIEDGIALEHAHKIGHFDAYVHRHREVVVHVNGRAQPYRRQFERTERTVSRARQNVITVDLRHAVGVRRRDRIHKHSDERGERIVVRIFADRRRGDGTRYARAERDRQSVARQRQRLFLRVGRDRKRRRRAVRAFAYDTRDKLYPFSGGFNAEYIRIDRFVSAAEQFGHEVEIIRFIAVQPGERHNERHRLRRHFKERRHRQFHPQRLRRSVHAFGEIRALLEADEGEVNVSGIADDTRLRVIRRSARSYDGVESDVKSYRTVRAFERDLARRPGGKRAVVIGKPDRNVFRLREPHIRFERKFERVAAHSHARKVGSVETARRARFRRNVFQSYSRYVQRTAQSHSAVRAEKFSVDPARTEQRRQIRRQPQRAALRAEQAYIRQKRSYVYPAEQRSRAAAAAEQSAYRVARRGEVALGKRQSVSAALRDELSSRIIYAQHVASRAYLRIKRDTAVKARFAGYADVERDTVDDRRTRYAERRAARSRYLTRRVHEPEHVVGRYRDISVVGDGGSAVGSAHGYFRAERGDGERARLRVERRPYIAEIYSRVGNERGEQRVAVQRQRKPAFSQRKSFYDRAEVGAEQRTDQPREIDFGREFRPREREQRVRPLARLRAHFHAADGQEYLAAAESEVDRYGRNTLRGDRHAARQRSVRSDRRYAARGEAVVICKGKLRPARKRERGSNGGHQVDRFGRVYLAERRVRVAGHGAQRYGHTAELERRRDLRPGHRSVRFGEAEVYRRA